MGVFGAVAVLQLPALGAARSEAFASWSMKGSEDEATRELFGTFLCLGWSLVLLRWRPRADAAAAR